MSKQLIYTNNTASTTVTPGDNVPIGNISRKVGNFCSILPMGNTILIRDAGYYSIDVGGTFTGTAGNVKLDVLQNGGAIATATETIDTATTEYHSINIPLITKVFCCGNGAISVIVDSASTSTPTFSNSYVRIIKE